MKFHGHSCPGLGIGARAALDCRDALGLMSRAEDEKIVTVAETGACGVKSCLIRDLLETIYDRPINTKLVGQRFFMYP